MYVCTRDSIPLGVRRSLIERTGGATQANLDLNYWGPGDEWLHAPTGLEVDVVYFDTVWMEDQTVRVLEKHQASLGYTTCVWHTIRHSVILFDPRAWFARLQRRCCISYPEALRRNIIALNHPVLRTIIPSYANQISKAVKRRDLVSINHRVAALFASYFDVLFAMNRLLHPGEKRQIEFALHNCRMLPTHMESDMASILMPAMAEISTLPDRLKRLLDRLDETLEKEGLQPTESEQKRQG